MTAENPPGDGRSDSTSAAVSTDEPRRPGDRDVGGCEDRAVGAGETVRERLRRSRWLIAWVVAAAGALLGAAAVSVARPAGLGPAFGLAVCALLLAEFGWIRWHLAAADRAAGRQPITAATSVTLCRAGLLAALGGFVVLERPAGGAAWLPVGLFAAASLLDAADGLIARARAAETRLGARLDVGVDSLGVLLGAALAASYGAVPLYYVAVGLARPLFVLGIRRRERRGLPVEPLDDSRLRRPAGALQLLVICLALAPAFAPSFTRAVATAAMIPLLVSFGRDWLVVTGRRGARSVRARDE